MELTKSDKNLVQGMKQYYSAFSEHALQKEKMIIESSGFRPNRQNQLFLIAIESVLSNVNTARRT